MLSPKIKVAALFTLLLAVVFGLPALGWLLDNGKIILLKPSGGAEWIVPDETVSVKARLKKEPEIIAYRHSFNIAARPLEAVLTVRALKTATVLLDGKEVRRFQEAWRLPAKIDLAPVLPAGGHELRVIVENDSGPAALLAYSDAVKIRTGNDWEFSRSGTEWRPGRLAKEFRPLELSRELERADRAFFKALPFLAPVFVIVFIWTFLSYGSVRGSLRYRLAPTPAFLRWAIMAALVLLAINNFWKLPLNVGFDQSGHLYYIQYIAENRSLPFANQGWQMFQSPLYYMVSAPIYLMAEGFVDPFTLARVLRVVPVLSGVLLVEAVYRATRHVFPERKDLQGLGLVVGALLPMNIYMSQYPGNEPTTAMLSAAAIATGLGLLRAPSNVFPFKRLVLFGIFLGLALLSKVTAVLLLPPAALLLACVFLKDGGETISGIPRLLLSFLLSFGSALLVSGWYYIRNWIYLGRPFVGGWDPSRGIEWWQYPGYRVLGHLYRFGESLFFPVYSSLNGFWDSLYSTMWADGVLSGTFKLPPWNYNPMLAGIWLGLIPAAAILIGIVISVIKYREYAKNGGLFSTFAVAVYVAALLDLFLKLPVFSAAKASYTSGITPCYAILAAVGFDFFLKGGLLARGALYGWLACWALASYASFFIR